MRPYSDIAITGASSGLGRALTLALAHEGVRLHLTGRDAGRLSEVAQTARSLGAVATETVADVTNAAAMADWVNGCGQLDLVIANAGVSVGPGAADLEPAAGIRAVFATNLDGVFNAVLPALAIMGRQDPGADRFKGRIAIVGSIAGLIASPTSPAYSAAKAALDVWVRAAAPGAKRAGIGLTIVRPGFIRTSMTARNRYPMPGLMDADEAAARILAGLKAGRTTITFPWWLAVAARLGDLVPKTWSARLPRKPAG